MDGTSETNLTMARANHNNNQLVWLALQSAIRDQDKEPFSHISGARIWQPREPTTKPYNALTIMPDDSDPFSRQDMPVTYPAVDTSPLKRRSSFEITPSRPAKHVRTYSETPVHKSELTTDDDLCHTYQLEAHDVSQGSPRSSLLLAGDRTDEDLHHSGDPVQDVAIEEASQQPTCDAAENRNKSMDDSITLEASPSDDIHVLSSSQEDIDFVKKVKQALKAQGSHKTKTIRRRQACRIHKLLELATPPQPSEALFLSGNDAERQVAPSHYFPGIIVTEGQQSLPLQTTTQFLDECYDGTAKIWIQDPSAVLNKKKSTVTLVREVLIGDFKKRFFEPSPKSQIPWNGLELAAHVEDGLRPAFLNGEDCRLLTKLKLPSSGATVSRLTFEPGWKEVEKWALLAQAGALTEPHQDSHGYSTYITMNQGMMGFGWLANPSIEERAAWTANPATYTGGRWRYIILHPGQTVFFPGGTVHFVFRLASAGDTLAFGGHVLRCSQIVRWVQTIIDERGTPDITNENLTVSAIGYLERVEKFVRQALKNGQVERWGGAEAIEEFLRLKAKFIAGVDETGI